MNYLAILVSGVVAMVIGGVWYGPLFGKAWMKLSGMSQEDLEHAKEKGMAKSYFWMFIGTLVMAYVLARFVGLLGVSTFQGGAAVGFWAWLGFVTPILLGSVLWEKKPVKLWVLNIAHYLVLLLVIGGILAVWN